MGTADTVGLIPLIAFIAILVMAYKYVGIARKAFREDKRKEFFVWAFGASVFANTVAMVGIGYFDQTFVAWYCILAMVCAMSLPARVPQLALTPGPVLLTQVPGGQKLSPFLAGNASGMRNMPAKVSGYNQEGRVRPSADERAFTNRKNERSWVK